MSMKDRPGSKAKYAWRELDRVEPPKRAAFHRVCDFEQTTESYDEATASEQASRCIQCPNPECVSACPLSAPIVELLALTADRQFKEAAELLFQTYSLPEIASHTCVGGRVCERVCILAAKTDPVPIRAITRFLLDYGWKNGLAEPAIASPTGQRVAVLGSGICGLVTADALSRMGYSVTVIDSRLHAGGRVMNGLPGFRVDKALVTRRVELLKSRGIEFRMGVVFGQSIKLSDLRREFNAVFLGFGRADTVPLEVPGSDLGGVHQAFHFISQRAVSSCKDLAGIDSHSKLEIDVRNRRVVVLGGGDTAMDALRTAIRLGAADALCIYRRDLNNIPADAEEYSNASEEGARFLFQAQAFALVGDAAGNVTHVRCVRTELGESDGAGRLSTRPIADSVFEVPADVVLVAYGFTAPRLPQSDDFSNLTVNARGYLLVDHENMTNLPGVFAGGSIVRGPAPLSEVVLDAREAATAIDRYLTERRLQT